MVTVLHVHTLYTIINHNQSISHGKCTTKDGGAERPPRPNPLYLLLICVFFILIDLASTIPINARGCESGTVRGLLDRKILEEHLQSSNESIRTKNKTKIKDDKNKSANSKKDRKSVERRREPTNKIY